MYSVQMASGVELSSRPHSVFCLAVKPQHDTPPHQDSTPTTNHPQPHPNRQVHQPQRWEDNAWRLMAALESQLGALVGANAYLTPPGTQGLAPHHDGA